MPTFQAEADRAQPVRWPAARLSTHVARLSSADPRAAADVRLWVTLARFEAVYHYHFKVNLRRLVEYPNLWGYARDLYSLPAFRDTTNLDHIKRHYYTTHPRLNPTRIVPDGTLGRAA